MSKSNKVFMIDSLSNHDIDVWAEHVGRRQAGIDVVHGGRVLHHDVILFFQHFESGQQLQDGIIKTAASGWNHQDSNVRSAAQDGSIRTTASGQQDRLAPSRRHCRIAVLGWQHLDGTVRTKESGWHHQDGIRMTAQDDSIRMAALMVQ